MELLHARPQIRCYPRSVGIASLMSMMWVVLQGSSVGRLIILKILASVLKGM